MSSKGFVNKAKSGARAMPAQWQRAAEKARLARGEKPAPKPRPKTPKKPEEPGAESPRRRSD